MITCYDVIRTLMRTEKGTTLEMEGKYLFEIFDEKLCIHMYLNIFNDGFCGKTDENFREQNYDT